jgi:hypothetical protein
LLIGRSAISTALPHRDELPSEKSASRVTSDPNPAFSSIAAGDVLVLIVLGNLPGHVLVQDHPTRLGCEIIGLGPSTDVDASYFTKYR